MTLLKVGVDLVSPTCPFFKDLNFVATLCLSEKLREILLYLVLLPGYSPNLFQKHKRNCCEFKKLEKQIIFRNETFTRFQYTKMIYATTTGVFSVFLELVKFSDSLN